MTRCWTFADVVTLVVCGVGAYVMVICCSIANIYRKDCS